MAHPNYARFINVGKNLRLFFCNHKVDFAVFGLFRSLNIAADHPRNKLTAVAYAEYGYPELQNLFCVVRRTHIKHGVRSAGKNNTFVIALFDFAERYGIRQYFRIDIVVAYTPRNQLIILTAEIEYKYFLHNILLIICKL